jgi:GH15 family glucan-1,4-alpha-glucosidase
LILDSKTKRPLPYANIVFLSQNRGTISNESGYFALNTEDFNPQDSILIQYIGYKNQKLSFADLLKKDEIGLQEELINLSEVFVYGNPPKAKEIIDKIMENKEKNYKPHSSKKSGVCPC